jgi:hypothetical protein
MNSNGTVNITGSNQCLDLTDGNLSSGIQASQEVQDRCDKNGLLIALYGNSVDADFRLLAWQQKSDLERKPFAEVR